MTLEKNVLGFIFWERTSVIIRLQGHWSAAAVLTNGGFKSSGNPMFASADVKMWLG